MLLQDVIRVHKGMESRVIVRRVPTANSDAMRTVLTEMRQLQICRFFVHLSHSDTNLFLRAVIIRTLLVLFKRSEAALAWTGSVFYCRPKTRFSGAILTNVDRSGWNLVRICCMEYIFVGSVWPVRCLGGQDQTIRLGNTKMNHNSGYTRRISTICQWQTRKCLGSGLCWRETFRKFLTSAEPVQVTEKFRLSCTQPRGKVFVQISGTDEKRIVVRTDAFWGSQSNTYHEAQMGNTKSEKNRVPRIRFIHSFRRRKFRWIQWNNFF